MSAHTIKLIFTGFFSTIASILGILYVPVLLMVICNTLDYITGLMAAKYRDGISSYKSVRGIFKKVSMWLLVIVGSIIDNLIVYTSEQMGLVAPFKFLVAAIVAVWIVCNEIISILENLVDVGINIPPFLMPLIKDLKNYTENIAAGDDQNE